MSEVTMQQSERPVFVIGASRSGTTMLRLMLNGHPSVHIPGESWFLVDLMDALPLEGHLSATQVRQAVSIVLGHWRWKEWEVSDDRLRRAARNLVDPTLRDFITCLYSLPLHDAGKRRWGDKTPGYTTEIERLSTLYPEAQFLHLIRDGRDVCVSLRKTGWHGGTTWAIARYWGEAVATACETGRSLPPRRYMEVLYEDLVTDSRGVLEEICSFLEEELAPGMTDFHQTAADEIPERSHGHFSKISRRPKPSDIGRWKDELPARHVLVFEAHAGSALALAGYEPSRRFGLPLVRVACSAMDWLAETTLPWRRRHRLHFPGLRQRL